MDKKLLSERDICTKFITPAVVAAGWDAMTQIREEYPITRGQPKRADYLLFYRPNISLARIEAKDNSHSVGLQQRLEYAETLNIPFVFFLGIIKEPGVSSPAVAAVSLSGKMIQTLQFPSQNQKR